MSEWMSLRDAGGAVAAMIDEAGEREGISAEDYDVPAIVAEITEPAQGGVRLRPEYGSWERLHESAVVWDACARHDVTEQRQQEREEAIRAQEAALDAEFHDVVAVHIARVSDLELWPLEVGDIQVRFNNEYRGGGLVRWPVADSFYLTLTAPDGQVVTHTASTVRSFAQLRQAIEEEQADWEIRRQRAQAAASRALTDAQAALLAAEEAVSRLRAERNAAVVDAVGTGLTAYRAAKILGLTPKAVGDILSHARTATARTGRE